MSVSSVGTCSNCGAERFWLSETLSLQLDDGRLTCLPHPAESGICEREHGLTLCQASVRGRLYREIFFICRHCGKDGETIERSTATDWRTLSVRDGFKWGWGSALVVVPVFVWFHWWQAAAVFGGTLLMLPGIAWRENRKRARELGVRRLPRPDAPGAFPVPEPTAGCRDGVVVGRLIPDPPSSARATGPCCGRPNWIDAVSATDEDRIPCSACGQGVMVVSQHAIH